MLCGCRESWLRLVFVAVTALLVLAAISAGDDSLTDPRLMKPMPFQAERTDPSKWIAIEGDGALVRRQLARGAIVVAFGTEMDLAGYRALADALKTPDRGATEEAVREEVLALRGALKTELARYAPSEVNRILAGLTKEKVLEALAKAASDDAPFCFRWEEFGVEVGFATFRYWRTGVIAAALEDPPGRHKGMDLHIVLPSAKQAYVRLVMRVPPRMGP